MSTSYRRREAGLSLSRWIAVNMIVLATTLGVGLWISPDQSLSQPAFVQLACGLALCWALMVVLVTRRARRAVSVLLIIAAASLAAFSLVGTGWFSDKVISLPVYRLLPTLIRDEASGVSGAFHPNVIAATLAPLLLFICALSLEATLALPWRVILWGIALFVAAVVLMTQSRGAWLAVTGGFVALGVAWQPRKRSPTRSPSPWRRAWVMVLAIAAACGSLILAWSRVGRVGSAGPLASVASRLEIWQRSLLMLRDMPFTGIGLAAFPVVMDTFYPSFLAGPDARVPHAHNLFLQVALDLGLFGLLAFVGLFAAALVIAWQAMNRAPRLSFEWCLAGAAATALVVIGLHGLVDVGMWSARSSLIQWILIGIGLSFGNSATQPSRTPVGIDLEQ